MKFNVIRPLENVSTSYPPAPRWARITGWALIALGSLNNAIVVSLLVKYKSPSFPKPWYYNLLETRYLFSIGALILVQHIARTKYPKLFWTAIVGFIILLLLPLPQVYAKRTQDFNNNLLECRKMADHGELKPGITPEACAKQINE